MAYRDAGRMEDAKIHLDEALKLNPENTDEVGNVASSYIREGKYKDAEDLLIRALQSHKDNSTLWLYLGNAMKNQRE